jgi:CRISPR-associated endonuclease/helicase Cas3
VYRESLLLLTWILLRNRKHLTLPDEIDALVREVYEEQVDPTFLQARWESALTAEGETMAERTQANQAIIGFPDDASWNDPARFVLFDEDEPGVHRTLMAQTRLGEDSVVAIPLWLSDGFHPDSTPDFNQAKQWFMRSVGLSRNGLVFKIKQLGVPEGWKSSPLLRNCYPLLLNAEGCWKEDAMVRLDDDLGMVYESKEAE